MCSMKFCTGHWMTQPHLCSVHLAIFQLASFRLLRPLIPTGTIYGSTSENFYSRPKCNYKQVALNQGTFKVCNFFSNLVITLSKSINTWCINCNFVIGLCKHEAPPIGMN